jgi:hypothetical protein
MTSITLHADTPQPARVRAALLATNTASQYGKPWMPDQVRHDS